MDQPFTINFKCTIQEIESLLAANIQQRRVGGFLLVVDDSKRVIGTITDSDIRRFRTATDARLAIASEIMNSDFVFVYDGMTPEEMGHSVLNQLERRNIKNEFPISYIPILNPHREVVSLIHISTILPVLDALTREIVIVGQGFVGLTLSMALVDHGIKIQAVENDESTFRSILALAPKVFEPRLSEILSNSLGGLYRISNGPIKNLQRKTFLGRRTYVIAIGTPKVGNNIDLDQITSAVLEIAQTFKFGDILIIRSTVPVGFTRKLSEDISSVTGLRAGQDFHLAYAPERTIEGNAIVEMSKLPQLVAGFTDGCTNLTIEFFSSWISSVVKMESLEACELAKLLSNAYRDVTFAFANEAAVIASEFNVDINRVIMNANMGYSRNAIPQPSPGVGGPCLTKDSYMLSTTSPDSIILGARRINEQMIDYSVNRILRFNSAFGLEALVIGVAFKGIPATNDIRNSPSVEIIRKLESHGYYVSVLDSVCSKGELLSSHLIPFSSSKSNPRIVCILNNHPDNLEKFREFVAIASKANIRSMLLLDPWNLIDISDFKSLKINKVTLSKTIFND